MNKRVGKYSIIVILVTIILFNIFAVVWFNNMVTVELESSAKLTLKDMAEEQSRAVSLIVENKQDNIKGIVDAITYSGGHIDQLYGSMEIWTKEYEIQTLIITDVRGLGIASTGETANIVGEDYFTSAVQGEVGITDVYESAYVDTDVVAVYAPIYYEGSVQGVIVAEYCVDQLSSLLIGSTDVRGSSMIVNSSGDILIHTYPFEISFENFKSATFEDGKSYESVLADFANMTPGSVTFEIAGDKKMGEYIPLGIEDWTLFFEISESAINGSAQNISMGMLVISVSILSAFCILIYYILWVRRKTMVEIEQVAYYDELTGASNLVKFKMDVKEIINQKGFRAEDYILLKGDVENFKVINEVFGMEVGDKVIRQIADTARKIESDLFEIARTGSDEFIVFTQKEAVNKFFAKREYYNDLLKQAVPEVKNHLFHYRYGRYFLEHGETDVDDIINKVSIAHSYARAKVGAAIWDYDDKFKLHMVRVTELTNKMRESLKNGEFKMFLQPKYGLENDNIVGAEALVRWFEADGNMVYPGEFIPLFEGNEFIVTLDMYMFEQACEFIAKRLKSHKTCVPISVNFSRLHLLNPRFVDDLSTIANRCSVPASYLEIELTETTLIENESILSTVLEKLHAAGFSVSIDDFGSGYSSLGMLKDFKFDVVKLDRSFFVSESNEEKARTVVRGIASLINSMGAKVVAEGVETKQQVEFLRTVDCYSIQGYYFSRPVPSDDFIKMLNK